MLSVLCAVAAVFRCNVKVVWRSLYKRGYLLSLTLLLLQPFEEVMKYSTEGIQLTHNTKSIKCYMYDIIIKIQCCTVFPWSLYLLSVSSFKSRLYKFWSMHDFVDDYRADP